jgi:hypothetical protein
LEIIADRKYRFTGGKLILSSQIALSVCRNESLEAISAGIMNTSFVFVMALETVPRLSALTGV